MKRNRERRGGRLAAALFFALGPLGAARIGSAAAQEEGRQAQWARGDLAVAALAKKLSRIKRARGDFSKMLAAVRSVLDAASPPWNRVGDDRVLSKMRNEAGAAAQALAKMEIERLVARPGRIEDKGRLLEALRDQINAQEWLAEGFKASIRLDIAFALADLKAGGG